MSEYVYLLYMICICVLKIIETTPSLATSGVLQTWKPGCPFLSDFQRRLESNPQPMVSERLLLPKQDPTGMSW